MGSQRVDMTEVTKYMSQMKGQDKTPEKPPTIEVEIGNLPEKRLQNNDGEDDPGSQKKNGAKD